MTLPVYGIQSGADCTIRVWDLSLAVYVCEFRKHHSTIYGMMFSRDGSILASGNYGNMVTTVTNGNCTGGMDDSVVLWDATVFEEEQKRKNASSEG